MQFNFSLVVLFLLAAGLSACDRSTPAPVPDGIGAAVTNIEKAQGPPIGSVGSPGQVSAIQAQADTIAANADKAAAEAVAVLKAQTVGTQSRSVQRARE